MSDISEFRIGIDGRVDVEDSTGASGGFYLSDTLTMNSSGVLVDRFGRRGGGVSAITTANDISKATENTQKIQAAVSQGGTVTIAAKGSVFVNSTVIVPSDCTVVIPKGTEITAVTGGAGGVNTFPFFVNENANSTPVSIQSNTSAAYSNMLCKVTLNFASAHGITSKCIQIKGDGRAIYNGIWEITASTSNSIEFLMSIAGGSTNLPPALATAVASASQSGVNFTTATNNFVAGQPVQLSGSVPTGFTAGTVYYVITTGLSTTNVNLALSPFASTGISASSSSACTITPVIKAMAADRNITITGGGKFNGNFAAGGFSFTNTYSDHGIILRRVRKPIVQDINFTDIRKYCIMGQDIWHPLVSDVSADTGSDGVHLYGPCWNPLVQNMTGTYGDDVAVFQNIDGSTYLGFMMGTGFDVGGDFFNGTMKNIRPRHTHNTAACTLYPQGNSGGVGATSAIYRFRGQVEIDGVSVEDPQAFNGLNWRGWNAVGVGNGYVPVVAPFDSLVIKNVYGPIALNNNGGGVSVAIDKVAIEHPSGDNIFGDNSTVNLDYFTIGNLSITSAKHSPLAGGGLVTIQSSNVIIDNMTFEKCSMQNANASGSVYGLQIVGTPTVRTINYFNCLLGPNGQLLNPASFVTTPTINIIGGIGNSYKCGIEKSDNSQSLNISIQGFTSLNPTIGLFNFYGSDSGKTSSVKLRVSGLNYQGTLFANQTGINLSMFNPDASFPVDITKCSRTAGSTAFHNGGTSAGTIVTNNLCICDATNTTNSWKQISNTTLVY